MQYYAVRLSRRLGIPSTAARLRRSRVPAAQCKIEATYSIRWQRDPGIAYHPRGSCDAINATFCQPQRYTKWIGKTSLALCVYSIVSRVTCAV